MKKILLGVAFVATAFLMSGGSGLFNNAAAVYRDDAQTKFFFSVVSTDASNGHLIILSGAGRFNNEGEIEGGGGFTHFNPVGAPPFPIIAHGTYKAKKVLSFDEVPGSPYGQQIAGVLTMQVELKPVGGPKVKGTMEVVCNVPPGNLITGDDEGVTLELASGPTFEPTGTGVTLFNPAKD